MKWILILLVLPVLHSCGFYTLANGAGCVIKGTQVLTPQGEFAIETLAPGREVLSWDEKQQKVVVGIVDEVIIREQSTPGTLTLSEGASLGITSDHPVYVVTTGAWTPVGSLKQGDQVSFYNQQTKATEIRQVNGFELNLPVQITYNLKVRHYENSFAAGVLAHFY